MNFVIKAFAAQTAGDLMARGPSFLQWETSFLLRFPLPSRPTTLLLSITTVNMKSVSRIGNATFRGVVRGPVAAQARVNCGVLRASTAPVLQSHNNAGVAGFRRCYHPSMSLRGLIPDAENPPPRQSEAVDRPTVPTDITTSEFHERADAYLDELVARLEDKQEETPDLEVEYSVCCSWVGPRDGHGS